MPSDGQNPDFLMEKLLELLLSDLAASEEFEASMVDSLRVVAESGTLGSVETVKRVLADQKEISSEDS
jgi:hypothetical protein